MDKTQTTWREERSCGRLSLRETFILLFFYLSKLRGRESEGCRASLSPEITGGGGGGLIDEC